MGSFWQFAAPRLVMVAVGLVPALAWGHPGIHEQEAAADKALAERPSDPDNYVARGKLHRQVGNWDAAIDAFEQARQFGAPQTTVSTLEGHTYLDAGWTLAAKRQFEIALEHSPNDPKARIGRARTWMLLEQPEKSEADFAVAFAGLDRVNPSLALERSDALLAAGRPDAAVEVLDAQIARLGQVPSLQIAAVEIDVEAERYDEALRRIDALLAQSPGHPMWAAQRADILKRAGRPEEARAAYRDALAFVQSRSARRGSRRLTELEEQLRAELANDSSAILKQGEE